MKKIQFCLFGLFGLVLALLPSLAFADEANLGGYGNTLEMIENSDVQMVNEQIKMFVTEKEILNNFEPITEVDVTYTFKNTSDQEVLVKMGFPEKTQTYYENMLLNDFKLFDGNGDEIETTYVQGEEVDYEITNWYTSEITFAPNEETELRNTYWIKNSSYKSGMWLNYILETGASWKDAIENVDIEVSFIDGITLYDIYDITPAGYILDKENNLIKWTLTNIEPTEEDNIEVRYDKFPGASFPLFYWSCSDFDENQTFSSLDEESLNYMNELASSFLVEDDYAYYPCRAYDGNAETAWVEKVEGSGENQILYLDVPAGTSDNFTYEKLKVFNGFGENEDLWQQNNRVKDLKITYPDGSNETVTLEDKFGYQEIDLNEKFIFEAGSNSIFEINGSPKAKAEILSVYEGTEFDDTAISEIRLLGLITPSTPITSVFSDISEHPFEEAITYLKNLGVIQGYEDGTFQPDKNINRAEVTKILVEGLEKTIGGDPYANEGAFTGHFSDVADNEWYTNYIKTAADNGWVNGYPDGTFKPANSIIRVEAIKMILLSQGIQVPEVTDTSSPFTDLESDQWYIKYVKKALEIGMIKANSDFLDPGAEISRGEVCQMLYNVIMYLQ